MCCFCCRDFKNSCYSNSYKSCHLKLLLRVQVFFFWIGVWVHPSGWWQIWREKLLDFRPKVLMEWTENKSYSSCPSSCFIFHKNVSHTETDVFWFLSTPLTHDSGCLVLNWSPTFLWVQAIVLGEPFRCLSIPSLAINNQYQLWLADFVGSRWLLTFWKGVRQNISFL